MCFSTYTNFELTYANISRLLTKIFDLALNVHPRCDSKMKSLGYSIWVAACSSSEDRGGVDLRRWHNKDGLIFRMTMSDYGRSVGQVLHIFNLSLSTILVANC